MLGLVEGRIQFKDLRANYRGTSASAWVRGQCLCNTTAQKAWSGTVTKSWTITSETLMHRSNEEKSEM